MTCYNCDKCGKLFKYGYVLTVKIVDTAGDKQALTGIDLCSKCKEQFIDFIYPAQLKRDYSIPSGGE